MKFIVYIKTIPTYILFILFYKKTEKVLRKKAIDKYTFI